MIIVFDIGTSIMKGGIIDQEGNLLVHSRLPIPVSGEPGIRKTGIAIDQWIKTFTAVSIECIRGFHRLEKTSRLQGVVISGNGPTFIPVGPGGTPLTRAVSWADKESRNYVPELNELIKEKVNPAFYLSKSYSLFKRDPLLYEKIQWFLPCPEFFSFYLTGNAVAILPAPGFTSYMWTKETIAACGMDGDKFPPFLSMGEEIGKVRSEISMVTGIPPGIPVFAGGLDFIMSLLGTNSVEPGRVCDRTGTSEGINICAQTTCEDIRLVTTPHIRSGLFNVSSILPFPGKVVDWFVHLIGKNKRTYTRLYSSLGTSLTGPEKLLFLPHPDSVQSGLRSGYRRGLFIGLTLDHGQEHIFKAIIEGLGYAVREIFELFHRNGLMSEEVRVSGIQASHDGWNKIRANMLGKLIKVPAVWDTELTGAASLGFASLGYFSDCFEASEHLVRFCKEFVPDKDMVNLYNDMYFLYKRTYEETDSILQELQ